MKDGHLYYDNRRWIKSDDERQQLLTSMHSDNLSGHFGREKRRNKICSRYYWLGMVDDIDNFVTKCDICQRFVRKFNKKHTELHPIIVKDEVWDRIGVDLIGTRGNRYIMTFTGCFSKWPEAPALKTKDADGVAAFLYQLMTRHDVANIVMSDQGREFVASVNKTLFELTDTDRRISSAYHPQTNGLDEGMNQTLTKSLLKLVGKNKDNMEIKERN